MTVTVDIDRLYSDLKEHFGTMGTALGFSFTPAILGNIDTMYEMGDYGRMVEFAMAQGFDIMNYEVNE